MADFAEIFEEKHQKKFSLKTEIQVVREQIQVLQAAHRTIEQRVDEDLTRADSAAKYHAEIANMRGQMQVFDSTLKSCQEQVSDSSIKLQEMIKQ